MNKRLYVELPSDLKKVEELCRAAKELLKANHLSDRNTRIKCCTTISEIE